MQADLRSPAHRKSKPGQAGDLPYESGDDDLEMLSKRKTRPKSGLKARPAGVYSRQDIREQYCINRKELAALEHLSRNRLFGCLSAGNLLSLNFNSSAAPPSTHNSIGSSAVDRTNKTGDAASDSSGSATGCKHSLSLLSCLKK